MDVFLLRIRTQSSQNKDPYLVGGVLRRTYRPTPTSWWLQMFSRHTGVRPSATTTVTRNWDITVSLEISAWNMNHITHQTSRYRPSQVDNNRSIFNKQIKITRSHSSHSKWRPSARPIEGIFISVTNKHSSHASQKLHYWEATNKTCYRFRYKPAML